MNLEQARSNMVEQQVRTWDVLDARVLDVFRDVPREEFVPARHRKLAFSDLRIPLGSGQVMMKPIEQGRCLQALALEGTERVLDIGTGSGFLAACLARLAAEVVSLDILESMVEQARRNLETSSVTGIDVRQGDALTADFSNEPFDAIAVTSSVPVVPDHFSDWLKPGGRLFIVRGQSPAMEAVVFTRSSAGRLSAESLFDTDLPRLIGAEDAPRFEL